jgi:hypothetical protein
MERWSKRQGQQKAPQRLTEAMAATTRQLDLGGVADSEGLPCVL